MIPVSEIRAWSNMVPWINDEQIELDLVICRSLTEIFSDAFLAEQLVFRGGTALHKLFLQPQPRYSEDIDMVQKFSGPISRPMNLRSFWVQNSGHYTKERKVATYMIYIKR